MTNCAANCRILVGASSWVSLPCFAADDLFSEIVFIERCCSGNYFIPALASDREEVEVNLKCTCLLFLYLVSEASLQSLSVLRS